MTDAPSIGRASHAIARRCVGNLFADADTLSSTQYADTYNTELGHLEQKAMQEDRKEYIDDTAGVGMVPASEIDRFSASRTLQYGSGNANQDELLRKRVLGSKGKAKGSGVNLALTGALGKRDRQGLTSPKEDDDSSEHEGRSGLGRAKAKRGQKEKKAQKHAIEIETFESMQREKEQVSDDGRQDKNSLDTVVDPATKKLSTRPKSYLDEVLEARKSKSKKRKRKKQLTDVQAGVTNE